MYRSVFLKIIVYVWVACLFSVKYNFAQVPQLTFKHITNEQGLSNSTIECIYQDSRGFMWFGTRDGLNRYDGKNMLVFKHEPIQPQGISDSYITCLLEDNRQQLWIGTSNGLNLYDEKHHSFTQLTYHSKQDLANEVTCLKKDTQGNIWIGTREGLFWWQAQTQKFRTCALPAMVVNDVFEDDNQQKWIATDQGVWLLDAHSGRWQVPEALKAFRYPINAIREDKQGNLLIATNGYGLVVYNHTLKTLRHYTQSTQANALANNLVKTILVDSKKNIWIGCINGGLNLFDPVSGNFFNYQYRPAEPKSLSQRTVSALFEDNQGNLWVGTHRGGINLYMPKTEKFTLYRQEPYANSLSYNDVKAFCEDRQGNIWIGTDGGGLNLFDRKKHSFQHFSKNIIGSNEILHIAEDSRGDLWIATWGGGLTRFNPQTQQVKRLTHQPNNAQSIGSDYVQQVFEDSRGKLWVATYYGGLYWLDPQTLQFTHVTHSPNKTTQVQGNNIVVINEDRQGNIWIGTDDGGLNCYETRTQRFKHYFTNDGKKPDIRVIFVDSRGRVWIGQRGLYVWDDQKQQFKSFTAKANLNTEFIKGIVEDMAGNLWIATDNGIKCLNPRTLAIQKYNTADGLQGLEFEANAFLKANDGEIFFGGVNGFNTFYPQKIIPNTFVPPIYLTDFQLFNKKIELNEASPLAEDISFTKQLQLSYKQSTFSIGFAALNYTASENNQYVYKLEGWDNDWITANNEARASYTNVSPGTYTFRVKATNNDGIWNEHASELIITITPPFWATWWFKTLVSGLILGSIIVFFYYKRKYDLQQLVEQQKEEIHQQQLQFFTNISHEFRTPLSLILGPLEKIKKDFPASPANIYYHSMYRNANRLMNLINELMDFRKVETGALKLHVLEGNVALFLNEIAEEFAYLAQEKNINFTVKYNSKQAEAWFDRQILEKIIINLLSNAFKYLGEGHQITLEVLDSLTTFKPSFQTSLHIASVYQAKAYRYIRVADDGIGISKESIANLFERYYKITEAHVGSGIGLAFVKSLTRLHKGMIWVYSEKDKGSEFIIAIPCTKDDYKPQERWIASKEVLTRLESVASKYDTEEQPVEVPKESEQLPQATILLVDDNDELRLFLRNTLGQHYTIVEASNGQAGYEMAKETFPDLIMSDVMMPVMDGITFCKKVKEDEEIGHIPFLMLTAKDATESKIEGVESGADFYFSKPISIELLELTIRNIFQQKQKLKAKYGNEQLSEIVELAHNQKDKQFLSELIQLIEAHLSNPEMNIDYICAQMGMSRTKLYTKVKVLTGQAIGDFIRSIRLKKALQLMTHENLPIAEVMYKVGIQTQSYFTKAFKNEFGKTPMQFLKDLKKSV